MILDEKVRPHGKIAALESALLDLTTRFQWLEAKVADLMKNLDD